MALWQSNVRAGCYHRHRLDTDDNHDTPGVLDPQFKANMTEDEAVDLAKKAVRSAALRDSASGDGVDIMIWYWGHDLW